MSDVNLFYVTADENHIKSEKQKARELRKTRWWREKIAKGVCEYCGKIFPPEQLTMDHIVPIIRMGKTTKSNIACACKDCNNKKKYLLPMELC